MADSIASQITMELAARNWTLNGGNVTGTALPAIMPHRKAKQPEQPKPDFTSDGIFNPAMKVGRPFPSLASSSMISGAPNL